jgi:hypothetical protein
MLKFKIVATLMSGAILASSFSFAGISKEYISDGAACRISQQRINYKVIPSPVIRINGVDLERLANEDFRGPYTFADIERYAATINENQ